MDHIACDRHFVYCGRHFLFIEQLGRTFISCRLSGLEIEGESLTLTCRLPVINGR
jgi:hypothetical protein